MKHRIYAFLLAAAVLLLGGCRSGTPTESAPESAAATVWRYAALGDSIPAGYGLADGEKSYPERLRDEIGAAYDRVEFGNFAVSGHTTAQMHTQVSALLTGRRGCAASAGECRRDHHLHRRQQPAQAAVRRAAAAVQ